MFDYSLLHWTTFLTAAVLLNLSPGPDIAFILGQTVRGGRRAGASAMVGVWSGALVHVLFAALGLSAILASSALAFAVVKCAGAGYLIYLGLKALRSSGGALLPDVPTKAPQRAVQVWRQGVLVSLLNPKVAIFFLAFLPQFIEPGAGPTWAQLMLHGSLIIAVAACIEPPLVLLGDHLTRGLRRSPKLGLWLDRVLGTLFITLGVKLALTHR
ncbi:lysine exporter protein LysE/YggA [Actibacterium atlanticum]|uniref:Lysine exporter protein LysE/YggA n=1 Tax=Actibacterium atlanticum TaxID=1461693 RepID=A0A058ZNS1_9RHOB|nr:LysE family translocator [Actibacterium atlanticum]KCV83224.1 lysine exporter protein LysE/YggA [Actibacterium atlanticum]